jgi:hypothetical protein
MVPALCGCALEPEKFSPTGGSHGRDTAEHPTDKTDTDLPDTLWAGADAGVDAGTATETDTGVDTETGTDTRNGVDTSSGADTGTGDGTETQVDTGTDTDNFAGTDTGCDTETETKADTVTDTETTADTETGSDIYSDAGIDTNTDTSTDTNTDTDTRDFEDTGSGIEMPTDTFTDGRDGNDVAERVVIPPTIDGSLDDAAWDPSTPVENVLIGVLDDLVLFDLLWDDQYLYIGVAVYDETLVHDSEAMWNDDAVEIVINAGNDPDPEFDENDDHCIKAYDDEELYCQFEVGTNVHHAWQAMPGGGYSVEIALPWSKYAVTPQAGNKIGLDIGVDDDDGDGGDEDRDNQIRWNSTDDDWWNTALYGEITLVER